MTPGALTSARRWPVISALGVVQIFAWGSSCYLLGVFAAPIAADTGWSLSWIVGGLSLGLFVAGIAAPRLGVAIRQHGGKPVLALSSLLLASGLVILATNGHNCAPITAANPRSKKRRSAIWGGISTHQMPRHRNWCGQSRGSFPNPHMCDHQ